MLMIMILITVIITMLLVLTMTYDDTQIILQNTNHKSHNNKIIILIICIIITMVFFVKLLLRTISSIFEVPTLHMKQQTVVPKSRDLHSFLAPLFIYFLVVDQGLENPVSFRFFLDENRQVANNHLLFNSI